MEKKELLTGKRICKTCSFPFPLSNFYSRTIYLTNRKVDVRYDLHCKKCYNLKKWELEKLRKEGYVSQQKQSRDDTIEQSIKPSASGIIFGSKTCSYYDTEFEQSDLLDYLINLKITDLSKNELKFYKNYEYNTRDSIRRNTVKNNIFNGSSSNKACIRRFETHFRLSGKTKSPDKSMLDCID